MSKEIPTAVLLAHAGSDYDDLPDDVKAMCDAVEDDLATVGVDVESDLAATDNAEVPVEAPASVTVTRDKSVPESFGSRGKARTFVSSNPGYKVVDNGSGAVNRWTVAPKSGTVATTGVRSKKKQKRTATATVTPAAAERAPRKKDVAIEVYRSLESAGTLKRSTFLAEMESRVGLGAKGASSYFYRIKGGQW